MADAAIRLFGGPASGGGILCLQRTPGRNNQGLRALDPGPRGGAVQVTCKTCKHSGLGSVWH